MAFHYIFNFYIYIIKLINLLLIINIHIYFKIIIYPYLILVTFIIFQFVMFLIPYKYPI